MIEKTKFPLVSQVPGGHETALVVRLWLISQASFPGSRCVVRGELLPSATTFDFVDFRCVKAPYITLIRGPWVWALD